MEYTHRKTLESDPATEPTALTMRAIKDILAESGDEGLLMTAADGPKAQTPQQSQAQLNAVTQQTQDTANAVEARVQRPSLTKRLANKLFG